MVLSLHISLAETPAPKIERENEVTDSLQYQDFTAAINYSAGDETYFGRIIGIKDLVIFEGNSEAELEVAFQEAVEDYLETCKIIGKL